MMQLVRDMVAINHYERILGRPLTDEEKCGAEPIRAITDDGVYAIVYIEVIPFESLYSWECGL